MPEALSDRRLLNAVLARRVCTVEGVSVITSHQQATARHDVCKKSGVERTGVRR